MNILIGTHQMTKALLAAHVIVAILAVGPVAVAASMYPAAARRLADSADSAERRSRLAILHRICTVYAGLSIAVPIFGFATAASLHVLGNAWLTASMALTGMAGLLLWALILPTQQRILDAAGNSAPATPTARLAMATGTFNLLWAGVVVLMVLRPGSATGA
jgi:hypothetical protein